MPRKNIAIVWPFSGGLSKIVAKLLTSCVWGQKFTCSTVHILWGFKLKMTKWPCDLRGPLEGLGGPDTVRDHQGLTQRSKGTI